MTKALAKPAGAFVLAGMMLTGCASLGSSLDRQVGIDLFRQEQGFTREMIQTSFFNLTAFTKIQKLGEPLHIYIEGDGRAWISKSKISDDPTPFHATAFELAVKDPASNVVYLARPCQYTARDEERNCDSAYWSNKRFSKEVIESENEAIDHFVKKSGAASVHLIGFSGGAAVAVLVAASRNDVASLRTVSGNLDPKRLNAYHRVDPPEGSLDPMDAAPRIASIPQRHFVGGKDKVVPGFIVQNFKEKMGPSRQFSVTTVKSASHQAGWAEKWSQLLLLPMDTAESSVVE